MRLPLLVLLAVLLGAGDPSQYATACTAVVVGRGATTDGSTFAAGSTDCLDCDFRLARVPARTHKLPAQRPVYAYKSDYPHVVSDRAPTWELANLEGTLKQRKAWQPTEPIGYVPQVERTFALFEGGSGYALINERGVSVGETSCPAKFVARPVGSGGEALLDVSELTKIGLERAKGAREAIAMMGELAETYGYYGASCDTEFEYIEAGESLMVADGEEAWVFHILPDDTGKSAIWAAQRVPDTDMTVVANNFIIRKVNASDSVNFMHSGNMHDIARRHGFWDPDVDGEHLDFSQAFASLRSPPRSTYSTMRVWRLFTMANPDLVDTLDDHANDRMDGYPFSVTPKEKLSIEDLKRMYRDHYEGTKYDLTRGEAGGPYGDPNRYDPAPVGNLTEEEYVSGEFGRAISLFRTSYTTIARGQKALPSNVGPLLYYSQQQASSTVFVPLYVAVPEVPRMFTRGSLFRHSNESMFWAVTLVSNWVHRYYMHALGDLRVTQSYLETYDVARMDAFAAQLDLGGQSGAAVRAMRKFSDVTAERAFEGIQRLFPQLVARFHDGFVMEDAEAERITMTTMFYPKWWLKQVGFFAARETGGSYGRTYESDLPSEWRRHQQVGGLMREAGGELGKGGFMAGAVFGALSSGLVLYWMLRGMKGQANGYRPIQ